MHAIPLPILIAFMISFVAAASRIFSATKPFWGFFPAWLQVLFPTLPPFLAAVQVGASDAKSWPDLTIVFIGAAALLLPGLPSHRSSAPLPNNPKPPTGLTPALMLCLLIGMTAAGTGCAWFKGSFWPTIEHCPPSSAALTEQVSQILAAGGDYETALEQLALADGKALVFCTVIAFTNSVGAAANDASNAMALARGRVFVTDHLVRQ